MAVSAKSTIFYQTGCTNKGRDIGLASITLHGKRQTSPTGVWNIPITRIHTWISRAELHEVPFTFLVQKGTSWSLWRALSQVRIPVSTKHSYSGCSYTCQFGFCANTASSGQGTPRHIFRHSLPVQQEQHTKFTGSQLCHPDSHSYANRNLTFPKVLSLV